MRNLTDEYFKNNLEQAEIELRLTEAIPVGVYYHNLILALAHMLQIAVGHAYKERVYRIWKEKSERK